jgi:hypothetical protein
MTIFETLNSFGITPIHLQLGLLALAAVFLVAVYWKLIVIGVGMIFCVVVFAMPHKLDLSNQSNEPILNKVPPPPAEYIKDCIRYTGHTADDCRKLWYAERGEGEELKEL